VSEFLQNVIDALSLGSIYALVALGIGLLFGILRLINFAQGDFITIGCYALIVPSTDVTARMLIGAWSWPALIPAICLIVIVAALLTDALIFRPLRAAPATAKAVASVGVMIVLQALLATQLGSSAVTVAPIFPAHIYQILGSRVPGDRLWSAAVIIALSIALGLWFRLSRFGLATRAAAETEKGAFVTGLSPQRIALVNWALSTVIAGVGGVLVAPIVPLTPDSYSLFIVAALAAALVGNFTRIGVTVAAAVVIGALAGLLPAIRAARLSPTQALWTL